MGFRERMSFVIVKTCPECGADFERHSGSMTTLLGFHCNDAEHKHDDNCLTRNYECVNGHRTVLSVKRTCGDKDGVPMPGRNCKWKGKETCFCHPGEKVDAWPSTGRPPRDRAELHEMLNDKV